MATHFMIGDQSHTDGVGTHAESSFSLILDGKAESLIADVGVDAEVGANGSVEFVVTTDGKEAFRSGILKGGEAPGRQLSGGLLSALRGHRDARPTGPLAFFPSPRLV